MPVNRIKQETYTGRSILKRGGNLELNELIESIDIVDFISQYVDLFQSNGEYWGISPFTFPPEKTPSFSVRREAGNFYDFSSGKGGGVFQFAKEYLGLTNRETIEVLKKYAGIDGEISSVSQRLPAVGVIKKYMKPKTTQKESSGIVLPENCMDKYEYRPDKLAIWQREGISIDSLNKFQVRYDPFSDRLVYPIRDLDGKIVNIGGRTVDPLWKEKNLKKYCYFYSWGTISTVYGLSENMESIQKTKTIILFEGAKSVMLADTWGINICGAILTSHLSSNQMKLLARLGYKVVFALDKEIQIRSDKNIEKLKQYVNVEYIWDKDGVLGEKDAPVDKGKEVFEKLFTQRLKYR